VSTPEDARLLRSITREMLAELLPGLLEEALAPRGTANGNGAGAVPSAGADMVPQVPAPPIATVHRPPGWRAADPPEPPSPAVAAPEGAPMTSLGDASVEQVDLRDDAELNAFVLSLLHRFENPRDRMAIRAGKLRFALRGARLAASAGSAVPVVRVEKGAVTERMVRDAAASGSRLVLARRAVLTPMARDRARSLGVEIEKERPC
jgi:hypothetical protein